MSSTLLLSILLYGGMENDEMEEWKSGRWSAQSLFKWADKHLFVVEALAQRPQGMITTFGLQPNAHSLRLVKDSLDMNALFD